MSLVESCRSVRLGLGQTCHTTTGADEERPLVARQRLSTSKSSLVIFFLCFSMLAVGSGYSLLAPFFPSKAKSKGVSELWIGLIVSQYQIAVIVGSPIFGKLTTRFSPKTGLAFGILVAGLGNSLMGLLEWTPNGAVSIVLPMLFRTIEGLGAASVFTCVWTIIFEDFPDKMSKLFATTEMFYGLGMIIGPALGGVLNQLGEHYLGIGFSAPFWVFGALLLISSIVVKLTFPTKHIERGSKSNTGVTTLLTNVGFSLCVMITINSALLIGFNEATLDLHLSSIELLSPSSKGGIFLLFGLTYTLVSQVFGYLGDKMNDCYPLCVVGCLASVVCFVIVGPLPFLNIESNLIMVIIGQVFLGIGLGGQFIGSFIQGYREIFNSGRPMADDMSTYAVLAGIFSSAYAIGSAVGPAIGGYMLGQLGYCWSTFPLIIVQIVMLMAIIIYKLMKKK